MAPTPAARVRRTYGKGEADMILLIAIVLGALVGPAAGGEAGALAGALFGWLILRSLRQQREIEDLRKRAEGPVLAAARRDARAALAPTEPDADASMAAPALSRASPSNTMKRQGVSLP